MSKTLTRQQQIEICKTCENKYLDIKSGLLCNLTKAKPAFDGHCTDLIPIDQSFKEVAKKVMKESDMKEWGIDTELREKYAEQRKWDKKSQENRRAEYMAKLEEKENRPLKEKLVHRGANWFYWIAALTLINSAFAYFESARNFIFGVGLCQVIDAVMLEILGANSVLFLIPSLIIASLFGLIGYHANKFSKTAFITGLVIYGLDALLFLLFQDYLSFAFHLFALIMIFNGYRNIKHVQTAQEPETISNSH